MAAVAAGFSGGCAGKTNVELVQHRLLHLYKSNGIANGTALFCSWDTFVYKFAHDTTSSMQSAARKRMHLIWDGWQTCVSLQPNLADSDCPQYVGLYMDSHIPIVCSQLKLTVSAVLCNKLAPEQQSQLMLARSDALIAAVKSVWTVANKSRKVVNDLFQKGKPGVLSVRYIRPQLIRCGLHAGSMTVAAEMLRAWHTGKYSTRKTIADPDTRIAVERMTYDELLLSVATLTSRQLYYIIAECIAVVTISHASLHVLAAGVCPQFQPYFDDATSPYHRKKRGVAQGMVQALVPKKETIDQWPLSTPLQVPDTRLPATHVHACDKCATVHIKTVRQPRAAKGKSGVSIDLANPYSAICNQCKTPTRFIEISNYITQGKVNNKHEVICMCAKCSSVCTNPETIGQYLYCKPCASAVTTATRLNAQVCPCGSSAHNRNGRPPVYISIASSAAAVDYITFKLCDTHGPIAYELSKLPSVEALRTVFRAITAQPR